jgi:hypothetical protein
MLIWYHAVAKINGNALWAFMQATKGRSASDCCQLDLIRTKTKPRRQG